MEGVFVFLTLLALIDGNSAFNYTNCGKRRPGLDGPGIFVVGGTGADPGEYPWQAALYRYGRRICGATVVHPEWIITAAHCVDVINDPPIFEYLVGSNTISNFNESRYHQFRETAEVYVHPKYRLDANDYDIALMRMSEPFEWDDDGYVYPACVPSADMVDKFPPGSDSVITGWGAEEQGGGQSDDLNEVTIPITNQTYCNESYGGSITDNMICAGQLEGGIDSCQGDSGGPMAAKNPDDGLWYLIGVVSWGIGCAIPGYPGVYARVTTFADWIEPIFNGGTPDGMPVGQCGDNDFQCAGGFCIPKEDRCDGSRDCYQYTDELYCENALKAFDVFFDKRLADPFNQTLTEFRADDSNGCGLYCLEEGCQAFDVLSGTDENNKTVCHLVFGVGYLIKNLTLNESRALGITHFQRGLSAPPGSEFTDARGTIFSPAYAPRETEVDPGLLMYIITTDRSLYNHVIFTFVSIKSQDGTSPCSNHSTQNLIVFRSVPEETGGGAIVKCLNEIQLNEDYRVNSDYAVLELYSHDPTLFGFIVDYAASWYCDSVETAAPGYILSPRYGVGDYPPDVRCRSLIQAPEGYRVRLEVEFFEIEFDGFVEGDCSSDWDTLQIYDGVDLMGTYCGGMIPEGFLSTSTDLLMIFKSDPGVQETGYKINFFFVPESNASTEIPTSTASPTTPSPTSFTSGSSPNPESSTADTSPLSTTKHRQDPSSSALPTTESSARLTSTKEQSPSSRPPSSSAKSPTAERQTQQPFTEGRSPSTKPPTTEAQEPSSESSELLDKERRIQVLEDQSMQLTVFVIILAAALVVVIMFSTIAVWKMKTLDNEVKGTMIVAVIMFSTTTILQMKTSDKEGKVPPTGEANASYVRDETDGENTAYNQNP